MSSTSGDPAEAVALRGCGAAVDNDAVGSGFAIVAGSMSQIRAVIIRHRYVIRLSQSDSAACCHPMLMCSSGYRLVLLTANVINRASGVGAEVARSWKLQEKNRNTIAYHFRVLAFLGFYT